MSNATTSILTIILLLASKNIFAEEPQTIRDIERSIGARAILMAAGVCPSRQECAAGEYVFSAHNRRGVYLSFYGITDKTKIKIIVQSVIGVTLSREEKVYVSLAFFKKPHSAYVNTIYSLFAKPFITIKVE